MQAAGGLLRVFSSKPHNVVAAAQAGLCWGLARLQWGLLSPVGLGSFLCELAVSAWGAGLRRVLHCSVVS